MKTSIQAPNSAGSATVQRQSNRSTSGPVYSWSRVVATFWQRFMHPARKVASSRIELRDSETAKLPKQSAGSSIEVRRGIVWLTGSAAEGDIILHEGDRYVLRSRTSYVAQAIGDADAVLS